MTEVILNELRYMYQSMSPWCNKTDPLHLYQSWKYDYLNKPSVTEFCYHLNLKSLMMLLAM